MRQRLRIVAASAFALLCAGSALAQQPQRERRAPDTDQTVNVTRGARLTIDNVAGDVVIHTWDRDALRVMARHSVRTKVSIRNTPTAVVVTSSGSHGIGATEFEITAPAWMPLKVEGTYNNVSIEGAQSEVSASTIRGDIMVKGGSGFVTATSIEGEVIVEGAKGRIHAESVNEGIRITGSSGDIVAETTNGDISLTRVDAKSVEAGSVNGDVTFEGTLTGRRYRFTTHNGDISLIVPESANASFRVRLYNGDFRTNLPLTGATPPEARHGRRVTFTLGSGSAEVELESFGGTIRIQRPGTTKAPRP